VIDEGVRSMLRKISESMQPRVEVRTQTPPEPVEMFDFISLPDAIGKIPISCLPRTDKVAKGGYAKAQPCVYGNVQAGLAALGVQVRLNLMNGKTSFILPPSIDMTRFGVKSAREIDGMIDAALCDIFHAVGIRAKKEVRDCMARIANSLYWHPARDWITSKPWDGQDRLEALLASVTTEDTTQFAAYFRRWALQTVEAACGWTKHREQQKALCLVLAGKQGIGKTRWLMSLAPGFCAEGKHLNLDTGASRDSKHEALQGMIVELGELDTTFKKTAVGSLKAFLSQVTDEYRLPYADEWLTRPRCTSFCASVNERQFLQDVSGNRRYACVWVTHCEPAHAIDMQQFWAQMFAAREAGEQFWLTPEEEAMQLGDNEQFQTIDGIVEQVGEELERRKDHGMYTVECSLVQSSVARLLELKFDNRDHVHRVGIGLRKHLGDSQNLRKRGGVADSWPIWVTIAEADRLGFPVLRAPMPKPE